MLSGRVPFHARSRDDSAAAVMSRIKGGEFNFQDEAWGPVSNQAKSLTKGTNKKNYLFSFFIQLFLNILVLFVVKLQVCSPLTRNEDLE